MCCLHIWKTLLNHLHSIDRPLIKQNSCTFRRCCFNGSQDIHPALSDTGQNVNSSKIINCCLNNGIQIFFLGDISADRYNFSGISLFFCFFCKFHHSLYTACTCYYRCPFTGIAKRTSSADTRTCPGHNCYTSIQFSHNYYPLHRNCYFNCFAAFCSRSLAVNNIMDKLLFRNI